MSERGGQIDAVQNGRLRIEKERNRMIVNDGSTDILLAGLRLDGLIAVEVAQEGFDVKTATDDQLVFSSRFNLFKIVDRGEIPITMPAVANGTAEIVSEIVEHDLGYSPLVLAWITFDSPMSPGTITTRVFGAGQINYGTISAGSIAITYLSLETVTALPDEVRFNWKSVNAAGITLPPVDATIKYYILSETAAAIP